MAQVNNDGPIEMQQVYTHTSNYTKKCNVNFNYQTGKRDALKAIERKCQDQWASARIFEVNAPSQEETAGLTEVQMREKYPKWFGNFPYPYMNGSLHLGHAFTISKIEFAAGFERMLGKRVLFPHGFHCTGMPIKVRSYVYLYEELSVEVYCITIGSVRQDHS